MTGAAASVGAGGRPARRAGGINAITWIGMARSPCRPCASANRTARLMFDEYLAFLLTFVLASSFERLWMPADRLARASSRSCWVHGYGRSRGVLVVAAAAAWKPPAIPLPASAWRRPTSALGRLEADPESAYRSRLRGHRQPAGRP